MARVFRDDGAKQKFRWIAGCITLCACLLLLGGCVHSTKANLVRHYTLGNTTPAAATVQRPTDRDKILAIAQIVVPSWLTGTAMYYRLDYRDNHQVAAYAHSDWIAPPATLLESIIQSTLAASGDWRAVLGPGDPASADASLHLVLDDFSQAFSQPHASSAVVDATATLVDDQGDSVIGQRHWHIEVAAPTANAQGGAKALGEASRKLAADLQRWLAGVSEKVH